MAIISSHILNGVDGTHAANVKVCVSVADTGKILFTDRSDEGGRLRVEISVDELSADDQLELTFFTRDYWQARSLWHEAAIGEIVQRFKIDDRERQYHMPVIMNPNGYSTWRSA